MTPGTLSSMKDHAGDLDLETDVVVVGSGAGGAVVACELAEAGQRVVVLEEGPNVPAATYAKFRPSESMRHLWREAGMGFAVGVGDSPMINVMMGRCVGGSSVLTGGVCFRIPEHVLHVWREERGLADLTSEALEPAYREVERAVRVEEVPEALRSRSTVLFEQGLKKRFGVALKPLRRNIQGCEGCGRCNFGCPHGNKYSVDVTYLPRAVAAGASVYADCLVERILTKDGRAAGVRGRVLNGQDGKKGGKLTVRARRVVVAAGAYHSPLLLQASGVGRWKDQVGRHLTLHPGFRVMARFDEAVHGWKGALQSAFTDAFEDQGVTLISLFVPVGVLAATMPGVGPEHVSRAQQSGRLSLFGGLLHDEGGGVVKRSPLGREPFVTYRMSERDRAKVPWLIRTMAEIYLCAGAKEVFIPVLGAPSLRSMDQLQALDLESVPGAQLESGSQHPLGTCRMGSSADSSVVDPDGQAWDLPELFVADGSIIPTSLGVNPQLTIMTMATRIAWKLRERPLPKA